MVENWHSYPTNYSNGSSVEGVGDLFTYMNVASGGVVGAAFTILIFIASFGVSLVAKPKGALAVASFISLVFSIYFWKLGMISPFFIILYLGLLIVGAVMMVLDKNPSY